MKVPKGSPGRSIGRTYTVARFPDGSWSYGGKPDNPDYADCEVWQIKARNPQAAIKSAQGRRYRANRATHPAQSER